MCSTGARQNPGNEAATMLFKLRALEAFFATSRCDRKSTVLLYLAEGKPVVEAGTSMVMFFSSAIMRTSAEAPQVARHMTLSLRVVTWTLVCALKGPLIYTYIPLYTLICPYIPLYTLDIPFYTLLYPSIPLYTLHNPPRARASEPFRQEQEQEQ